MGMTNHRLHPVVAAAVVAAASMSTPAAAQVGVDPLTAPIPLFQTDHSNRALVVDLSFDGPDNVSLLSVDWTNAPPPANVGNPPHYLVRAFTEQGLAQEFDIWNPLWTFDRDEEGHETLLVEESATASIVFPFDAELVLLQVLSIVFDPDTDEETNTPLITVDLRPAIESFCTAHPDHPECDTFDPPNAPPVVAAGDPIATTEGVEVTAAATFTDANAGDTHTATIDWGDGTAPQPAAVAGGAVSGTYVYADNGVYIATITVTDSAGSMDSDTLTITVANAPPAVDAGNDQAIALGDELTLTVSFTDPGTADTHTATVDWGDGSPLEAAAVAESPFGPPGSTSGAAGTVMASHVYAGPGIYTVTVTVIDDDGASGADDLLVNVIAADPNRPPIADAGGPYLGAIDTAIALTGEASSDPDGQPLTYEWSAAEGTIVNADTSTPIFTASAAGIYPVQLEVCDTAALCDTAETTVVAYDPSAGFVTGGGWIDSPAGACGPAAPDGVCGADATGRANFSFVSRYRRGAKVPDGETRFTFTAGNLRFESDSYEWLVVSGQDRAQFKGIGTINGVPGFQFMLTAYDGADSRNPDGFRIKIWTDAGRVYDNRDGADDKPTAANTQPIAGGSIVIHAR
jgi:PKD repeat protein